MSYINLLNKRKHGIVRFSELLISSTITHAELLSRFGFTAEWKDLKEIKQPEAQEILTLFLWKDAAYQMELMPLEQAKLLVASLPIWTSAFSYFTNGNWKGHYDGMASWTAFTEASFDGGIIAASEPYAACYWFEDED
jgi:hypothetical protein